MANRYRQLAEELKQQIRINLREGIPTLPPERRLGELYHVSRQTVRAALSLLEQEGLITRRRGSGSYLTGRLAAPHQNTVGILIPDSQEPFWASLLGAARGVLEENGFETRTFHTENQIAREREILCGLLTKPPRALLVRGCKTALPNPNLDLYRRLLSQNCPAVFLGSCYPALDNCACIRVNNYGAGARLADALIAQGHTAAAVFSLADDLEETERFLGFAEAMQEAGFPIPDSRIVWYTSREQKLLLENRDVPLLSPASEEALSACTAAVFGSDLPAWRLIRALPRSGRRVPSEMTIAVFGDPYLKHLRAAAPLTFTLRPREMGTQAARAVLARLRGLPAVLPEIEWELTRPRPLL